MTPRSSSGLARRTALQLLRWYPIRWRARYEREMKALLEDMPVGWGHVTNLAGVAVREWLSLRAFGWPSPSSADRILTVRWWRFVGLTYAIYVAAHLVAARLVDAHVVISRGLEASLSLFSLVAAIRIAIAPASTLEALGKSRWALATNRRRWPGYMSDREVVIWMMLFLPYWVMTGVASGDALKPTPGVFFVWLATYFLLQASDRNRRLKRLYRRSLRHSLRILNIPGARE